MPCSEHPTQYFTLVFSGTVIGDHVHKYTQSFSRVTDVEVRHNFWANSVILDGAYPALVWEHEFSVYKAEADEMGFTRFVTNLSTRINTTPLPLELRYGTPTVIAYGNCYLDTAEQEEPDSLLHMAAGLVTLRFKGTSIPTVNTIT